jgi:hypothetical protein
VNPASVQGLHSTLRSTGVIILDESIVEALSLDRSKATADRLAINCLASFRQGRGTAYILVRNDLDILDMSSCLEDLPENILRHALVKAADVERPLVGLRRRSTDAAGRGEDTADVLRSSRRGDGGRDRVVVLRNVQRRRGNSLAVLPAVEARGTRIWLRGQLARIGRGSSVGHG